MLCYGFLGLQAPLAVLKFPLNSVSSCTMWILVTSYAFPHATEQDSQPIAFQIIKQVVPYQTHGGTCCFGVSTPKNQSLVDLSKTNHISLMDLTISTQTNPCSNDNIEPHHGQLTSQWMENQISQH
jgi:hypothetical protein